MLQIMRRIYTRYIKEPFHLSFVSMYNIFEKLAKIVSRDHNKTDRSILTFSDQNETMIYLIRGALNFINKPLY